MRSRARFRIRCRHILCASAIAFVLSMIVFGALSWLEHRREMHALEQIQANCRPIGAHVGLDIPYLVRPLTRTRNRESLKLFWEIEKLDLSRSSKLGDGLRHLKDLPNLEELSLRGQPITDTDLNFVGDLTWLKRLDLSSTPVTTAGLERLHGLHYLEQLDLRGCSVADETLAELRARLPSCKVLVGPPEKQQRSTVKFGRILSVAHSPDGKHLAGGASDGNVYLWDGDTGKKRSVLSGHSGYVRSVAFSPGGDLLASGGDDRTVILWERSTGQERLRLDPHSQRILQVAFSPDGTRLASLADTVHLWDCSSGELVRTFDFDADRATAVAFAPKDGTLAVALSTGRSADLVLWSESGTADRKISVPTEWITDIAFSPDGQLIAGASGDSVLIWDASTGVLRNRLTDATADVRAVAFSPDGTWIAAGCRGPQQHFPGGWRVLSEVDVWGLSDLRLATKTLGDTGTANDISFSPDGTRLAWSDSESVRVIDVVSGNDVWSLQRK